MIFDAFGRLALGQVKQDFGTGKGFLTGVSGSAQIGQLGHPTSGPQLTGVSGAGSVGAFSGGSTSTGGTPIGALLTITLGVPLTSGGGDKIVAKTLTGVAGTGTAGVEGREVDALLNGVTAFGQIGGLGNAKFIPVLGVGATSGLGTVAVAASNFAFFGVEATGQVGTIGVNVDGFTFSGVEGLGRAGTFNTADSGSGSTVISGGGGGKKGKTGLEPIAKRPPQKPEPVRLPTYVVPNFKPKPQVSPPLAPSPFERPTASAPLDLMAMQKEIQAAQDEADIKSVLEYLDSLD